METRPHPAPLLNPAGAHGVWPTSKLFRTISLTNVLTQRQIIQIRHDNGGLPGQGRDRRDGLFEDGGCHTPIEGVPGVYGVLFPRVYSAKKGIRGSAARHVHLSPCSTPSVLRKMTERGVPKASRRAVAATGLALACAFSLVSCGGGGGSSGGNGGNPPMQPPPSSTSLVWDNTNWDEVDWQ